MSKKGMVLTVLSLLFLWEIASLGLHSPVLPGPGSVLKAFFLQLGSDLAWHTGVSTWRVAASMALAFALALPLGLVLGQSHTLAKYAAPVIYTTYPVPKIVLLPIVILLLGIGDLSKIFLLTLILFYQVLVVVWDAARNIRPELVRSVRSLGANRAQLLRYVYFPACLPSTLTALRLSTGTAIAVLYFTESFDTRSGLGFYIMDSWQALAYPQMYAAALAMALLGLAIYLGLSRMEKQWCRWVQAGQVA